MDDGGLKYVLVKFEGCVIFKYIWYRIFDFKNSYVEWYDMELLGKLYFVLDLLVDWLGIYRGRWGRMLFFCREYVIVIVRDIGD